MSDGVPNGMKECTREPPPPLPVIFTDQNQDWVDGERVLAGATTVGGDPKSADGAPSRRRLVRIGSLFLLPVCLLLRVGGKKDKNSHSSAFSCKLS